MAADRLVAIFGAGRNGSTLLGRLLDGSPGLWVHPAETNYLCVWDDLARFGQVRGDTQHNARTRPLEALDRELPTELLLPEYAGHRDELADHASRLREPVAAALDPLDALRERSSYGVASFLPALLERVREAYGPPGGSGAPLLAFKTIETPYVADYLRVFPGLRCLHIVREPSANYASAKRTWMYHKRNSFYHGAHDHLRTFLDARWVPHARAVLELVGREPETHAIVRYEELSREPVRVLGEICAWLGVEPPPEPEELTVLGGRRLAALPPNPSQRGIEPPGRVVADMAAQFGYRDVLAPRERALIARRTTELAVRLGYARPPAPPGAFRLWLAWLPPDESERLHVHSRARWLLELARRRLYVTRSLLPRRPVA